MMADPSRVATAANQVVARGLATAVRVTRPNGSGVFATPNQPPEPWAGCAAPRMRPSARRRSRAGRDA